MAKYLTTLNKLEDLKTLRALYKANCTTQILGYQILDNYISWFEREPCQKHIKVYTLPEVWKKNGLYLIVDRYHLMVNALDTAEAAEELRIALPQLDWSLGYKMLGVPDIHYETILKLVTDTKVHNKIVRLHIMKIPKEEVLQMELSSLPEEFEYRPLAVEDAATVDDIWYSRQYGSLEYIKQLIAYNLNIGICLKSTGELIAWCIRCNMGLLGMLHVKDAYRGRGLALAIVQKISQKIVETGNDVYTMISVENFASLNLFKKLKFNESGITYIFRTKRYENGEIWSAEHEAKES